ncbi:MAG: hypothetical protein A2787_03045 [Omnitrophica WOR_2 bacterium RIFCSPHIGHO2_01_FULL_48_9]|nr:MAG: hypothetical protein A3D10_04350 [Omnitrophica WOR_2 bacterium RIFCSPHIGHO2_02_FULL_48_11]OGX34228.1 MAG: hypothetical protein A2787_03045 [Omnitrophica WOR_2 bacterium RIFCSPHIGHO2_01_FULL_48_9]
MQNPGLFLVLLFQLFGCGQPPQQNAPASEESSGVQSRTINAAPQFQPFYVYLDKGSKGNHFIPSGFMPNGQCLKLEERWKEDCAAGETCIRIIYDTDCSSRDQRWAGIYWLNPANNWGNQKGGFNLTGAHKFTFWARGEKGGERIEEFKIGGISGDYPDSDMAMIGPVILTKEWRQYAVDLRGKDLSYISGGLSWAANVDANPESCTFFLDDLKYE